MPKAWPDFSPNIHQNLEQTFVLVLSIVSYYFAGARSILDNVDPFTRNHVNPNGPSPQDAFGYIRKKSFKIEWLTEQAKGMHFFVGALRGNASIDRKFLSLSLLFKCYSRLVHKIHSVR